MEKDRRRQKELHCVIVDLNKQYDRLPWEELWYCLSMVQEMYEDCVTVVWCAAGVKGGFTLGVELHQESTLSPCLQDFFFHDGWIATKSW